VSQADRCYEDTAGDLQRRYGDRQLAAVYWAQLKAKILLIVKSRQEFAAAVDQFVHRALVGLPVDFMQREGSYAIRLERERPKNEAAPLHWQ
jgi:hypothetical protein